MKRKASDTEMDAKAPEFVFELDKKKQVRVRQYNGISLVDIREFYVDKISSELKPGKKGIALSGETWEKLIEHSEAITSALRQLSNKKTKFDKISRVEDSRTGVELESN